MLGPLAYEFGWSFEDYDLMSAGSLAGHVIECGCQCTGGNFTDWELSVKEWVEHSPHTRCLFAVCPIFIIALSCCLHGCFRVFPCLPAAVAGTTSVFQLPSAPPMVPSPSPNPKAQGDWSASTRSRYAHFPSRLTVDLFP